MVSAWLIGAGLLLLAIATAWYLARASGPPPGTREHPPGRPYPTRDGSWVHSKGEQVIADWLAASDHAYVYEPELAGGLTPDFHLVGTKVVIEYWGMAGQPSYEERMAEKVERYEAHGFEVVSVFPMHVDEMEAVLEDELSARGIEMGSDSDDGCRGTDERTPP